MSVAIYPSKELEFYGPFDHFVTSTVTIQNTSSEYVAYKILTNASVFTVKPNAGRLPPGSAVDLIVTLTGHRDSLPDDFIRKWKLMVKTFTLRPGWIIDPPILELWKTIASDYSHLVDQHKLRCKLVPAQGPRVIAGTNTEVALLRAQLYETQAENAKLREALERHSPLPWNHAAQDPAPAYSYAVETSDIKGNEFGVLDGPAAPQPHRPRSGLLKRFSSVFGR